MDAHARARQLINEHFADGHPLKDSLLDALDQELKRISDELRAGGEERLRAEGAAAERAAVREKIGEIVNKMVFTYAVYAPLEALLCWLKYRDAQDHLLPGRWWWRAAPGARAAEALAESRIQAGAYAGKLVAFLESGRPVILADVPPGEPRVETTSFEPGSLPDLRQGERIVQVGFRAPAPISPERAKGREEGLELARKAVSDVVFASGWHGDLRLQIQEAINKAAEAAKEESR